MVVDQKCESKPLIYRSNEKRRKLLIVSIWIVLGFELLYLSFNILEYHLLRQIASGIDISMKEISHNDIHRGIIFFFSSIAYFFTIIYFIRWFRRSYKNIHFFTGERTKYKHGWAALSWFIPILNFYRPFLIMREIWMKSDDLLAKIKPIDNLSKGYIVMVWWIMWLLATFFGKFIVHFIMDPWNINELMSHTLLHILASILWVVLTFITIKMIRGYSQIEGVLRIKFVDQI